MKAASSALPLLTVRSPVWPAGPPAPVSVPKPPEQHVEDAAVHAFAHDVGQDRAGGADQGAGDDQRQVLDGEADAAGRPAGVAVQHGDDDGHVGAADRDDEQEAERDGQQCDGPEDGLRAVQHEEHDQHEQQDAEAKIQLVLEFEGDRRALHQRLQLGERDERAGEGDGADGQAERHLDQALGMDVVRHADAEGFGRVQRRRGDEHRSQAHQRVEGGHQLRQRRHFDALRDERARSAADGDAGDDEHDAVAGIMPWRPSVAMNAIAMPIMPNWLPALRRRGFGKAAQRQDEQDGGDEVQQRCQVGGHDAISSST